MTALRGAGTGRLDDFERPIAQALAELGARLPERDRTPWGEPVFVPYEQLMEAVDQLHAADLPLGSWGFNHYESRAWVTGYAHLDLRAILGPLALPPMAVSALAGLHLAQTRLRQRPQLPEQPVERRACPEDLGVHLRHHPDRLVNRGLLCLA